MNEASLHLLTVYIYKMCVVRDRPCKRVHANGRVAAGPRIISYQTIESSPGEDPAVREKLAYSQLWSFFPYFICSGYCTNIG